VSAKQAEINVEVQVSDVVVGTCQVADVQVIRTMCGTITCKHCNNVQDAGAYHHERNDYPLKSCALRCSRCGNPWPEPKRPGSCG